METNHSEGYRVYLLGELFYYIFSRAHMLKNIKFKAHIGCQTNC